MDCSKSNDETINLSDLKLSKLEREREMKKQHGGGIHELNNPQLQKIN